MTAFWAMFFAGLGLGLTAGVAVALAIQFNAYRDLRKHLERGRAP